MNKAAHARLGREVQQVARPLDIDAMKITLRLFCFVLRGCEMNHDVLALQLAGNGRRVLQRGNHDVDTRLGQGITPRFFSRRVDGSYDGHFVTRLYGQGREPAANEAGAARQKNFHAIAFC